MAFDQRPPPSEAVASLLSKAQETVAWINDRIQGVELPGDHRHRIPAQLFDLAIEHHASIAELLASRLYASGFALVRCEFEAFIRGAWLHHCATDQELETFVGQDVIQGVPPMVVALEEKPEFAGGFLSAWKDQAWVAMNGYTHGGIHQISRRMQGEYIEPNFEEDSLLEVIRFSTAMALLSLGQIAAIADNQDLWEQVEVKMGQL